MKKDPEAPRYICIRCPLSCEVFLGEGPDGEMTVGGHGCRQGEDYAREEYTNPVRTLTSTVRVLGAPLPRIPVRTGVPIPKKLLRDAMIEINRVEISAPVDVGQVVIENLLGTGVALIATRTLPASI